MNVDLAKRIFTSGFRKFPKGFGVGPDPGPTEVPIQGDYFTSKNPVLFEYSPSHTRLLDEMYFGLRNEVRRIKLEAASPGIWRAREH